MRMNDALTISGLTKTYKDFVLDGVSFSVPWQSLPLYLTTLNC